MNRRTMLIGGVAVAALVALLAWAFPPRPVEVEAVGAAAVAGVTRTTPASTDVASAQVNALRDHTRSAKWHPAKPSGMPFFMLRKLPKPIA